MKHHGSAVLFAGVEVRLYLIIVGLSFCTREILKERYDLCIKYEKIELDKMARLFNRLIIKELTKIQAVRYGNKANHWSKLKKKKSYVDIVLKHFDDFYGNVYGYSWKHIRAALLEERHKYMAVVNTFSDVDRIKSELETQGAINLKVIYDVYMEENKANPPRNKKKKQKQGIQSVIDDAQVSAIRSNYPVNYDPPPVSLSEKNEDKDLTINHNQPLQLVEMKSIEPNLNEIALDESRIVHPTSSLAGLYEFVPATKLKGLEDWILESQHYSYYKEGAEFSVKIEKEEVLTFPKYLNIYTFEENNNTMFPSPRAGSTGVSDYYLLDGASVLPVLALDLQPGDVVLDMCAAPGGKTLTILQTLMPRMIVANDVSLSRTNRINNVINQFVADLGDWHDRLFVTQHDARYITDKDMYNKILVDVPCTTDRHVLHSEENNIFRPTRIRERLQLPELQTDILANALKIVAVGGTVVYATCSLSPVQNDGVVGMALKRAWEETNFVMVVKDMEEALSPLTCLYKFGNFGLKYGHIVIPTQQNNWGPMYFCKITRVR